MVHFILTTPKRGFETSSVESQTTQFYVCAYSVKIEYRFSVKPATENVVTSLITSYSGLGTRKTLWKKKKALKNIYNTNTTREKERRRIRI